MKGIPYYKGNCYAASEAACHLLGGKKAGWKPMRMTHMGAPHWFLRHKSGLNLDLTADQFAILPDYSTAIGCGFLTGAPSKRAADLMHKLLWKVA